MYFTVLGDFDPCFTCARRSVACFSIVTTNTESTSPAQKPARQLPIMLLKPIIPFGTSLKKSKKRQAIASAVAAAVAAAAVAVAAVAAAVAHVQHEKVVFWWKKKPLRACPTGKSAFLVEKKAPAGMPNTKKCFFC